MIYGDFVNLSTSTSDDTLGTSANITLNGRAKRILFVGALGGQQTLTAAEGTHMSFEFSGDVGISPVPRVQLSSLVQSGLATTDGPPGDVKWMPVDWPGPANGVVTVNSFGIGGAAAQLYAVHLMYSDGEAHPMLHPWSRGLRAPGKFFVSTASTGITASTTETALAAITVPGSAKECVGFGSASIGDGVRVTALEFFVTARWTATGASGVQFEPAQRWPTSCNDFAGQGTPISSQNHELQYAPVRYAVVPNSTMTALHTFRSSVTNASLNYPHAAFV